LRSSIGEFQGNFCQPVLHALTLTRACHADSTPYRRCPWVPVQHPLQHIFIGKTEISPLCPKDEMIQDIDPESRASLFSALGDGALSL
jgi:hypothetical protein